MRTLTIAEVMRVISAEKTKRNKIDLMHLHESRALKQLLKLNYDKSCNVDVSLKEDFKISPRPEGFGDTSLHGESKRFYIFFEKYQKMDQRKRQMAFNVLVESLDPIESSILLDACNRKLKLGLTAADVDTAFPGLIEEK